MTKTIFCDIDGTITHHHGDITKNILEAPTALPNVLDTFKRWDKSNYNIILTTGRKESYRDQTEKQLQSLGLPYDKLLMGIPNGDRVIINDKKPNGIENTTYAINLVRNQGFENINSYFIKYNENNKIDKPWGYEEIVEHNQNYVVKKLFMKKGHSCSTQYHELKTETIVILQGKLKIYIGEQSYNNERGTVIEQLNSKEYNIGESITIKPYTIHKMEGIEDCLYLETSTPELWDVVRLQDNYGRV
jgi:mannose-6-phosphate isomerase-like protein (cupin superfamily)